MSKEIRLTQGYLAIVDDEDFEWLSRWKWCANVKAGGVYAYRTKGNGSGQPKTSIYMHRQILCILGENDVKGDHRDGNTLDNRRSNLRTATHRQNCINQKMRRDNTTGVKGVDYVKKNKRYRARVFQGGEDIVVGYARTLEKAKALRESAQQQFYGEYVRPS